MLDGHGKWHQLHLYGDSMVTALVLWRVVVLPATARQVSLPAGIGQWHPGWPADKSNPSQADT
jgi:hypothetical protein